MRVALIGPLPPALGGSTPGGVASHQAHLAAGLAQRSDVLEGVVLLGTNVRALAPATAWCPPMSDRPYPLLRSYVPTGPLGFARPGYLGRVGPGRLLRYMRAVRAWPQPGSRREVLGQLLWYAHFLDRVRPDVIHVQHPLERHLFVRAVTRLEGVSAPVVVTAHSFFGEHPAATIDGLMAPNLRIADAVIAVSPHIAEQATQLGAEPARVWTIRSGVDTARFQPRERTAARQALSIAADARMVLFVGNLEPRKQVDVLLQALPSTATLAIIGSGESAGADDQTTYLQGLVDRLDLGERVRFVGRVPDEALLQWYAAADVFALPSSSEAQGIAALEAMACGLPVVASAVGGLLGTIDDGHTGYLVPPGDVAALGDRLQRLLDDRACAARLGHAARAAVLARFSWPQAVAATVEVYRAVCATRPRSAAGAGHVRGTA